MQTSRRKRESNEEKLIRLTEIERTLWAEGTRLPALTRWGAVRSRVPW